MSMSHLLRVRVVYNIKILTASICLSVQAGGVRGGSRGIRGGSDGGSYGGGGVMRGGGSDGGSEGAPGGSDGGCSYCYSQRPPEAERLGRSKAPDTECFPMLKAEGCRMPRPIRMHHSTAFRGGMPREVKGSRCNVSLCRMQSSCIALLLQHKTMVHRVQ